MTNNSNKDNGSLPLPIARSAMEMARRFAGEQPTREKGDRVFANTLAVSIVRDYLQMMGIDTNIDVSDSFKAALRVATDAADLVVSGIGRLECRAVFPGEEVCTVPPEAWGDRIGYVVIRLEIENNQGVLLGFLPTAGTGELRLEKLRSLHEFLDYLYRLRREPQRRVPVNLSLWTQQAFEKGWETIESLEMLLQPQLQWSWRTLPALSRAGKRIDLGDNRIILIVGWKPRSTTTSEISVRVMPKDKNTHLPPNLQLSVLDECGQTAMLAEARDSGSLEFQFDGSIGELFDIRLNLGSISVTETFGI